MTDTMWVTDEELIRRSGVPEKKMRQLIQALDKNPLSGFPVKNSLYDNRRFWPAVVEYWRNFNQKRVAS